MKYFTYFLVSVLFIGCATPVKLNNEYKSQRHRIGLIIYNSPKIEAFPKDNRYASPGSMEHLVTSIITTIKTSNVRKKSEGFDVAANCRTLLDDFKSRLEKRGQTVVILDTILSSITLKKLESPNKKLFKYDLIPFIKQNDLDDLIFIDFMGYGTYKAPETKIKAYLNPGLIMVSGKTNEILWSKLYAPELFQHSMPGVESKQFTPEQLDAGLEGAMELYVDALFREYDKE